MPVVIFRTLSSKRAPESTTLAPSERYLRIMVDGATAADLDPVYLERLKGVTPAPHPAHVARFLYRLRLRTHEWTARQTGLLGRVVEALDLAWSKCLRFVGVRLYGVPILRTFVPCLIMLPHVAVQPCSWVLDRIFLGFSYLQQAFSSAR